MPDVALKPGDRVRTPFGIGTLVHHFPAAALPEKNTWTVRVGMHPYAVPFYTHEITLIEEAQ